MNSITVAYLPLHILFYQIITIHCRTYFEKNPRQLIAAFRLNQTFEHKGGVTKLIKFISSFKDMVLILQTFL